MRRAVTYGILVLSLIILYTGCTALGVKNLKLEEVKKKYTDSHSRFVNIDGNIIHYKDEGTGPTLVLVHGVCASLHTWDGWTGELKGKYRVIRMDLPGFGVTGPVANGQYTLDNYMGIMEKFLKALDVKDFYMAGNSLGGYISWNFALRHPDQVKKLILIDPVGYRQDMPWLLSLASHPVFRPMVRHMMPRFLLYNAVKQVYGDKSKVNRTIQDRYFELAMREGNKKAYVGVFAAMREMNHSKNLSTEIKNIKVPTLLMWGRKDEWIPVKYVKNWQKDLPGISSIVYEGAGHTPMEEIPVKTAGDASRFCLGSVKDSGAGAAK